MASSAIRIPLTAALLAASLFLPFVVAAAVPPAEADRLGGPELTPLGAERAGNDAGTIPPWTGGITTPPPNYRPGKHHADPFPDDPVVYTVTSDNLSQYAEFLSEGQKALILAHPQTWRMNVYPTRRSASYPEWVYAAVKANATTAELITSGKGGVLGARTSSPFPLPRNAVEIIWNHNLRWRGIRIQRSEGIAAVTRAGNYNLVLRVDDFGFPYGSREPTPFTERYPNIMLAVKVKVLQPAILAGDGFLVLEPINQTDAPRKAWVYFPGLRRILRQPYFAYDHPAGNMDNLRTIDEFDLFNGPPDRFEWTLLGKRELLVPYNAYRLHSGEVGPEDIITRHHIEPDLARYELHRVWVVEGRLKKDARHIYSRRVLYIDEDSWQILVSDSYDLEGELWRTAEAHALNFYEVPVLWSTLQVYYDFKEERYLVNGLDNRRNPYRFSEDVDPREFSPSALNYYIR